MKSSMSSGTKQFKQVGVEPWDESKGLDRQSGFVSLVDGQLKFQQGLEIKNPQNTILIIYNHGGFGWKNRRSKCHYWGHRSILADLSGHIINGKTTTSWINCELWKAKGDDGYGCAWKNGGRAWTEGWWNCVLNDSSLENRFELNVALLKSLAKRGFPPKQIFVLGHSCGAWNALRLSALHPELLNSGIAMMPNCWDKSRDSLIRKKFVNQMRSFSKSNALVLHSPVDGSVDYESSSVHLRWIDDIQGVEWIELPKSISNCRFLEGEIDQPIKRGHDMPFSNCWLDYHPAILKYIEKRVAAEL